MHTLVTAYSQSDVFGKGIFLALYLLSILSWIVLVHKIWLSRKLRKICNTFQLHLNQNKEQLFGIQIDDSTFLNPFAEVFKSLKQKSLEILDKNRFYASQVYLTISDLDLIESHALTTISSQSKALEKNLFILSTVVTLAPFLGLLGTVWGILLTFNGLQTGASANSNSIILGGLSTALATTVLGLVIAIPALVAYNYLKSTTKTFSSDMEDFLYTMLSHVELQYRKADA